MTKPLFETQMKVKPEWIDHNGHMNVAYYVLAFDLATDAVYEQWDIGLLYPERENCSLFTLGMNVDYLSELFDGDSIVIKTQLIDLDKKRIHYLHSMFRDDSNKLCATNECLAMNIDLTTRKSAAFPSHTQKRLETVQRSDVKIEPPAQFGRVLEIRRNQ